MQPALATRSDVPAESPPLPCSPRLVSLDAYRGVVMLLMASGGFGLHAVAKQFPDSRFWQFLGYEFTHVRWRGCAIWDLIQPAFMFIVGVALPLSMASRRARGESWPRMYAHALWRAAILILLGVMIFSEGMPHTNWIFMNTLCQIGLAYVFAFLLVGRHRAIQVAAIFAILLGYWWFFYRYPLPSAGADLAALGVPAGWERMTGLAAHWEINTNPAAAFDRWFLNLFPRPEPFLFREGGGGTLNFVPTIATMAIGVLVGEILLNGGPGKRQFRGIAVTGAVCLAAGILLDPSILPRVETVRYTLCPIIKRIWTPSWALYSGGLASLVFAAFFWAVDLKGRVLWTAPLVVVGRNSIAMFLMASFMSSWIRDRLQTHLGRQLFAGTYGPLLVSVGALAALWLACLWLYRRRVFLKI